MKSLEQKGLFVLPSMLLFVSIAATRLKPTQKRGKTGGGGDGGKLASRPHRQPATRPPYSHCLAAAAPLDACPFTAWWSNTARQGILEGAVDALQEPQ